MFHIIFPPSLKLNLPVAKGVSAAVTGREKRNLASFVPNVLPVFIFERCDGGEPSASHTAAVLEDHRKK
ncbi:hypothetical protein [Bacillus atrophaeus]|nr:hypothetical protein [Bacillus atrophaeus]